MALMSESPQVAVASVSSFFFFFAKIIQDEVIVL